MENKIFLIVLFSSVLAVFAGAFLAFYLVFWSFQKHYQVDVIPKKLMPIAISNGYFSDADNIFKKQQKLINEIGLQGLCFQEIMMRIVKIQQA